MQNSIPISHKPKIGKMNKISKHSIPFIFNGNYSLMGMIFPVLVC